MHHAPKQNPWPVNVVIMAGGKGSRLRPLTTHTHKSLITVGEKPIIGHMLDHLAGFGVQSVCISTGHLSDQLFDYVGDGAAMGMHVGYIREEAPMGSIGALTLRSDWEHGHFLVINGDVFTNFDLHALVSAYFSQNADMGILTGESQVDIPYGVLDIHPNGNITGLREKPQLSFQINAGIYIFNRKVFDLLPNAPTEGWELVNAALHAQCRLLSVPISDGYWIDIGSHETLEKARQLADNQLVR